MILVWFILSTYSSFHRLTTSLFISPCCDYLLSWSNKYCILRSRSVNLGLQPWDLIVCLFFSSDVLCVEVCLCCCSCTLVNTEDNLALCFPLWLLLSQWGRLPHKEVKGYRLKVRCFSFPLFRSCFVLTIILLCPRLNNNVEESDIGPYHLRPWLWTWMTPLSSVRSAVTLF